MNSFRLRWLVAAALFASPHAFSQDSGGTLLVLDASGSMWGRLGPTTKIEIARDVIATMLDTWEDDEPLGLVAYGHRRKGDCTDIEVLQPSERGARDVIRQRLVKITPKGMTPMGDAVIRAAQALRSQERKATVILVSDGEETCDADPCAVAKALEDAGVDLTVHTVGFDVAGNPDAKRQLRCIADATGGQYLDAADASELGTALRTVADAVSQAPPSNEPTRACGEYTVGELFMEGMATWPTGGAATTGDAPVLDPIELEATAQPMQCKALCDSEDTCTAWWFEPVGSNFRTLPVCFRWPATVALSAPAEGHAGSAMGVKQGIKQIEVTFGAACDDDR